MNLKNVILVFSIILLTFSGCSKQGDKLISDNSLLSLLPQKTFLFFNSKTGSDSYSNYKKSIWFPTDSIRKQIEPLTKNNPNSKELLDNISYLEGVLTKFTDEGKFDEVVFYLNESSDDSSILNNPVCYVSKSKDKESANKAFQLLQDEFSKATNISLDKESLKLEGNCRGNKALLNDKFEIYLATKDKLLIGCSKISSVNDICTEKSKGEFIKSLKADESYKKISSQSNKLLGKKSLVSNLYINGENLFSEVNKKTKDKSINFNEIIPLEKMVFARGISDNAKKMIDAILLNVRDDNETGKKWIELLNSSKKDLSTFSVPKNSILNFLINTKALVDIISAGASSADKLSAEEKAMLDKFIESTKNISTLGLSLHPANGPFPIPGIIIKADGKNLKESYGIFLKGIKEALTQQGLSNMGTWQNLKIADTNVDKFISPFGIGVSFAFKSDALYISSDDNVLKTALTKENSDVLELGKNQIQTFNLNFPEMIKLLKNIEAQLGMFTGGKPLFKDTTMLDKLSLFGPMSQSLSFENNTLNLVLNYSANEALGTTSGK